MMACDVVDLLAGSESGESLRGVCSVGEEEGVGSVIDTSAEKDGETEREGEESSLSLSSSGSGGGDGECLMGGVGVGNVCGMGAGERGLIGVIGMVSEGGKSGEKVGRG